MKKVGLFLVILISLSICAPFYKTHAAISSTPIQEKNEDAGQGGGNTTEFLTLTSNPTQGNVIILLMGGNPGNPVTAITQTNVTWTKAVSSNTLFDAEIWYGVVGASAGKVITITNPPLVALLRMNATEWSGIDTLNPVNVSGSNSGTGTTATTTTITPTSGRNQLVVSAFRIFNTPNAGPSAGFTPLTSTTVTVMFAYNVVATTTGSYSNTYTSAASGVWEAEIASFNSLDVLSPTVSITAPTNSATVSGSSVSVVATSTDNVGVVGVQFKLDGNNLGSEDTTSTYGITWDTTSATNGSHTLLAVSRDAAGNYATSSPITVTVSNPDIVAPTTPSSFTGTVVSPTQINLTWASSTDAFGVTGYRVYRCTGAACSPTTFIATSTILSYADSSLSQTTQYGFAVSAVDAAFNESTKSSTFATTTPSSADVTVPTVSVTAPTNGASVSGSISVTANAADNIGVFGVQFKLDNINLGSEDTTSTYGITWDSTTATNGSHTIVAVARDAAGNYATSSTITVTVSNSVAANTSTSSSVSLPSSQTRRSVSRLSDTSSPSATLSQGVINLILQNRVLFTEAVSLGIYIDPSILQVLGIAPPASFFNRNLSINSIGTDVTQLQEFLIAQNKGSAARTLARNGPTHFFGNLTLAALAEFQAAVGIFPAQGYFGPITRSYVQTH